MRTFTFKSLFLTVLFMLLGSLAIQAADDGLITRQIKLDEAGTLPDKISANEKNLITNLKIVGKINGTDLKFIREMAGRGVYGGKTDGKLSILDLSEAKIVEGGDAYFLYWGSYNINGYYTSNDKLGDGAFSGCSGLTSLTIPSGVTSIGNYAFNGCSGLTSIYVYPENLPELGTDIFTGCDAKNCTVYVPKGTYDAYKSSEFGYFENIVDGINKDGLLTTQVTIKLDEAGTLPYKISANEKNLITNLKIVGKINGTDLKFIREMAGRDYYGKKTDGKLSILDLSEAKIVEGGSAYISYNGFCQYTYNDRLGYYAFYGCSGLTSLTIPSGVTWIGWYAFNGCSGLTSIYVYPENLPELGTDIFTGCDAKNCTVYVPKGTYDAYKSSEFGYFEKIVEFDASGIDKVTTSANAKEVSRYSANGQRLSAPAKGLNIVKYSDGSVKKVVVQ